MKTARWEATLACLFALQAMAYGQQFKPMVIPAPKDARINQTLITPLPMLSESLVGEVRILTADKRLGIQWSYDENGSRGFHVEEFDLSYWPTAAARLSDARLTDGTNFVVAGKRPVSGKTVIELWQLAFSGVPSDSAPTSVTKTVLYDANVAGRRVVRMMSPVNGIENAAWVQFDDSNSLYRLDSPGGQLTLVLTPQQQSDLPSEKWTPQMARTAPGCVPCRDGTAASSRLSRKPTPCAWCGRSEASLA